MSTSAQGDAARFPASKLPRRRRTGISSSRSRSSDRQEQETKRIGEIRGVVKAAVYATCPYSLRHLRDDIVQGAMVRVVRAAEIDDERLQTKAYLRRVAHSAILDELRISRRRGAEQIEESHVIDESTATSEPGPESHARSVEIASAIRDCLQTLVEARRRVVTLNLLGYGLTEIADLLQVDRKRIDNWLYRGMANLRECLTGKAVLP